MLASFSLVFLVGLIFAEIFQKIKLPRVIGMLLAGIILGPFTLNLLDSKILGISTELRQIALIIILIKAGLSLNIKDLKKVGYCALMMSFIPALFEMLAFVIFAPLILNINRVEAAILGAVLGAVSPAIVVPRMVQMIEEGYGTDKNIPQMILAGASLDDVFVIVLFTSFINIAQGDKINIMSFINIPVSIILGIALGGIAGLLLSWIFKFSIKHNYKIRNSLKVIIILGAGFLMYAIEAWLKNIISVSGLLAVMCMALVIATRNENAIIKRLQEKFGKLWLAAEIILFVMVGAAVNISYTLKAGFGALFMIFIGLIFRSLGVLICVIGTKLNTKEKIYCIIAYLPKATVQAAIGSIPLSLGLPCGNIVLSVAVMSILITAPLGAIAMDSSYKRLLTTSNSIDKSSDS